VSLGVSINFFRNVFESLKMCGGIPVPERVIRDDIETFLEKCLKFLMH
jgi:hypothetical protein